MPRDATSRGVLRSRFAASRRPALRQWLAALAVLASLAGLVVLQRRDAVKVSAPTTARSAVPVLQPAALASTWFCPGVPGNDESISGRYVISNAGDTPVGGTITRFVVQGAATRQRFAVQPRSTIEVDALVNLDSSYVASIVETQGAPVSVEQRIVHRAGDAVSLCASSPSAEWFLADGFTGEGSIEQVVVSNPALDSAILDVTFVTANGERSPQSLKGVVIPPESVRVFDLAALDAQNEATLAVSVRATVGRVVVGRSQHYLGRGRLGYGMSLGASATSTRWYFADSLKASTAAEEYIVFNPSRTDQQVTMIITPDGAEALEPVVITAPAQRVTKFAPSGLSNLPAGRYSVIASVSGDGAGVVIERAITSQEAKSTATVVALGAPAAATRWTAPSGVAINVEDSLRVFNAGANPATFSVTYLGPAGEVPVVGYESVSLAPGASASVMLGDATLAATVTVVASEPVVVARRVSRGVKQPLLGSAPLIAAVGQS